MGTYARSCGLPYYNIGSMRRFKRCGINLIYKLASYTYGPLLGIFFYGILSSRPVRDGAVPYIAAASPLLCILVNLVLKSTAGFDLGFSVLIVNALFTALGMQMFSKKARD